jgi:hypothetical protein
MMLRMVVNPETQGGLSAFAILVISVPALAALATAIVSVWREYSKKPAKVASDEIVRQVPLWKRLRTSGWVLIVLAILTCVTGLYSGISDLKEATIKAKKIAALHEELTQTRASLTEQLAQSRQETIAAKNATIKATQESADRLAAIANANAAELGKEQKSTFESLLSSVTEPSYGIIELDLQHPIGEDWQIRLINPTVGALYARTNDDNWRCALAFDPVFNYIRWMDPVPIYMDALLGYWSMHDDTHERRAWGARVAVKDRTKDVARDLSGSMEVRDVSHLVIRLPKVEGQSMLDLWRGPEKRFLQLHIWIKLSDVVDAAARHNIEDLARNAIKRVISYYTVNAKSGLCKKGTLIAFEVYAAPNQLSIEYIGAENIENVLCPDYVIASQSF